MIQYLVIVGDDGVVPFRRIRDEAVISNERTYAQTAYTPVISGSLEMRYLLSDDYYAGVLPRPYRGRELYLPQYGIRRLVEKPSKIAATLDAFTAQPVIARANAFVTGYDFMIDEAQAISRTLRQQGIGRVDALINNDWGADAFRSRMFTPNAHGLNSLNAHFQHYRLFPNDVFAKVAATTTYTGALIFSVGCHSGLNVPDEPAASLQTGTDWAQAFLRRGATFSSCLVFLFNSYDRHFLVVICAQSASLSMTIRKIC